MLTEHCPLPAELRAEPETQSVELRSGESLALDLAARIRRVLDEVEAERRLMLVRAM